MQPRQAFARARMMFAAIAVAIQKWGAGTTQFAEAMQRLGPYRSRGKGQGGRFLGSSSRCVAMDKRDAQKRRNKLRAKGKR